MRVSPPPCPARVLQEKVVPLTIVTEHVPVVPRTGRIVVEVSAPEVCRVVARCGFVESPRVPSMLAQAIADARLPFSMGEVTCYLGRETFFAGVAGRTGPWTESRFALLDRNAHSAPVSFGLPPGKVVELGVQIDRSTAALGPSAPRRRDDPRDRLHPAAVRCWRR